MRPRASTRGNLVRYDVRAEPAARFNEAAGIYPRKPRRSVIP